jgi:catechol 2,3-dioxygenase-like lactoylglutathione lyase family enzyme
MDACVVVLVDRGGIVRAFAGDAPAVFGHEAVDVVGGPVEVLVPAAYRAAHRARFEAVMAGAAPRIAGTPAHLPLLRADGAEVVVPGRLEVVRGPDGSAAGAVATFGLPTDAAPFTAVDGPPPQVRRIVANLAVADPGADAAFWTGLLGLDTAMDLGWIVNHRAGAAQVQLVSRDATAPEDSRVSVEVTDIDAVYARAVADGYEIVHPLTDEAWGVRRFFVRTPQGVVVNVLAHA